MLFLNKLALVLGLPLIQFLFKYTMKLPIWCFFERLSVSCSLDERLARRNRLSARLPGRLPL